MMRNPDSSEVKRKSYVGDGWLIKAAWQAGRQHLVGKASKEHLFGNMLGTQERDVSRDMNNVYAL